MLSNLKLNFALSDREASTAHGVNKTTTTDKVLVFLQQAFGKAADLQTIFILEINVAQSDLCGFSIKLDRKSTRLNSSHEWISRMPSSA